MVFWLDGCHLERREEQLLVPSGCESLLKKMPRAANMRRQRKSEAEKLKDLSKLLSYHLRGHSPESEWLAKQGYFRADHSIAIKDLVRNVRRFRHWTNVAAKILDLAQTGAARHTGDKIRFEVTKEGDEWYIRSHVGHGRVFADAPLEDSFVRLKPGRYDILIHGTTDAFFPEVMKHGIRIGGTWRYR